MMVNTESDSLFYDYARGYDSEAEEDDIDVAEEDYVVKEEEPKKEPEQMVNKQKPEQWASKNSVKDPQVTVQTTG